MIWVRPGLTLPSLDAVFFDLDGVIIDATGSYRQSVRQATQWLVREGQGLAGGPTPLVTEEDIAAFKLAGGWNNDWDLTTALASLWTARLREWAGTPLATVSLANWAERAAADTRAGRGGMAWLRATVPASALLAYDEARWAHDEVYWGATLVREHYGHEPTAFPEAAGLVHNERLLVTERLFARLQDRGMDKFAVITGRVGPEVRMAMGHVEDMLRERADDYTWHESHYGRSPFITIISSEEIAKPDPTALVAALSRTGAHGAIYAGDATDDLMLVTRYRAEVLAPNANQPPVLAAMIATDDAAATHFQQQGADLVLSRVEDLPQALALASDGTTQAPGD
ncbi:MAG TPA: HAD family hydrolase [Ktedonobacterales bacterium]